MAKPSKEEYVSFYQPYIDVLTDESLDLTAYLLKSLEEFKRIMQSFGPEKEEYRYASGKWSVKEVVQHLIDAERVFVYRAMRFSRGDTTVLPGFDENAYADNCPVDKRSLQNLIEEFASLRKSTVLMFDNLDEEQLAKIGLVDENRFSVSAIGYICSGHVLHHLGVLKERYT